MPHPLRTPILFLLLISLALTAGGCSAGTAPTLSAPEAHQAASEQRLTLIDVRTPQEWRQTGVAPNAQRIDMSQSGGPQAFITAVLKAVDGDKDAPIALICRTGSRSALVQRVLLQAGFTDVADVSEGMAGSRAGPGWLKRGLPVTMCQNC